MVISGEELRTGWSRPGPGFCQSCQELKEGVSGIPGGLYLAEGKLGDCERDIKSSPPALLGGGGQDTPARAELGKAGFQLDVVLF